MPTGQRHKRNDAIDDGKGAPTALLAMIGETARVNPGNNVEWPFPDIKQNELAVRAAIAVLDPDKNELNETDAWSIASQAMKEVILSDGGGKPIKPGAFLKSADKIAAAHFRKSSTDYILLTSLSVESLPCKTMTIGGCKVSTIARRSKFKEPEAIKKRSHDPLIVAHQKHSKYLPVKVHTSGRTAFEATDRALDALNLLRGLWTLFATFQKWSMSFGSTSQEPIGVIHTGAIHTLHNIDGSPAVDLFWYEPGYGADRKLFKPKGGWKKLDKHRLRAMQDLKRCPFGMDIGHLIMRYATALDQADMNVAFMQMWAILEKLTDTVGANYDETIDRLLWVFADRKAAKERLDYLRMRRNQYIHASRTSEEADQTAYMVKAFLDPHLLRLIRNDFDAGSLTDHGKFLALPTNMKTLEKRRDELKRAIKIRSKKSHPE
jgi:hypothetical protein